jgi:hypothetical protein
LKSVDISRCAQCPIRFNIDCTTNKTCLSRRQEFEALKVFSDIVGRIVSEETLRITKVEIITSLGIVDRAIDPSSMDL